MKDLKHLFTALLLLCTTVATAHNFEVGGIYYNITNSTNKTVAVTYKGSWYDDYSDEYTGSVVIPESVTYNGTTYSVTSIGWDAFHGCKGLTSITIPNSVTSIGSSAFSGCKGLTSITIPNSVTSIGNSAFANCSGLTSVEIPNSVTSIGGSAFYGCSGLTSITIPNSVTSIENYAFYGCTGLTSIVIPNSVTSIGEDAFSHCSGLTSVEIPNSVTSIGNYAFYNCDGLTSITIPNSVTSIGDFAFAYCDGLTSITIPNSVTSIGNAAFKGCSGLTSIIVDDNNTKYDSRENCNAIIETETNTLVLGCKNTIIPNSVTSIGSYAFSYCSGLTSIVIPNSVTSIGKYAFSRSDLTSVEIPNSVTSIEDYAFSGCSGLTSVEFNAVNCTTMGSSYYPVLNNCTALSTVTIGENVKNIPAYAFCGCTGLTSIEIPNSVTSIGYSAFYGTAWYNNQPDGVVYAGKVLYEYKGTMPSNTSITIKDGTLSITDYAFYNCDGLTSITIPNSVTSIGYSAFYGTAWYNNQPVGVVYAGKVLYEYKGTMPSNTSIIIKDGTLGIAYRAFYNCTGLTSIEIPNSVTSIGGSAFSGCDGLTSITIPNSVTSIGSSAFYECTGLKTVYNFSNLTFSKGSSNNGYVAYYADKVYNAPNGSIEGDFIFSKPNDVNTLLYYLGNTANLTLPTDYKGEDYVIGSAVFKDNTVITSVTIPNSVTSVGDEAFWGCKEVTNINIIDGVKSIGNCAFYGCNDLETLYISNTIESIGDYAFAECNNILDIKIGSKKAITASENIFSSDAYINACLYVPNGRKFAYERATPWNKFYIVEMDFTGIESVEAEGEEVKDVYYDLSGRVVENPSSGIYIINGKKVVIK